MLSMLGCITSHSFTPVSGVKNSDDGDRESEELQRCREEIRVLKRALKKSRKQSRDLECQNHTLTSTFEALMDKARSDSDADPRATFSEVFDELVMAPGTKDVSSTGEWSEMPSYEYGFMKNAVQYAKKAYSHRTKEHPNDPITGKWNVKSHEFRTDSNGQTKTSGFNASGKV